MVDWEMGRGTGGLTRFSRWTRCIPSMYFMFQTTWAGLPAGAMMPRLAVVSLHTLRRIRVQRLTGVWGAALEQGPWESAQGKGCEAGPEAGGGGLQGRGLCGGENETGIGATATGKLTRS